MRIPTWIFSAALAAIVTAGVAAQTVRYVYDELGRLVAVIAPNGDAAVYEYDAVGNVLSITRKTSGAVSIFEFSPDAGPVGTVVTLYGIGFSATPSQNTVTFNGTSASVTASTTTSITVAVPPGATTGTVAVTTPSGSATSATAFSVVSATNPTITSFTPNIGTAGTSVSITGTNFETTVLNNRLALNLKSAWPSAGTSTSLTTAVPLNSGSGKIFLRTLSGAVTSTSDFFVPPPPFSASDVQVTDRLATADPTAVQITTANKIGLVVFDGTQGARISLKAVPGSIGSVKIYRPDLGLVAQQGIGVFTVLLEPPLLTHTGTYSVLVDPSGAGTGTTTLTVYDVPADFSGTITAGGAGATPVQVSTTVPGQNGRLTFSGTTGDRIAVAVSFGPGGTVSIVKPDATVHASGSIGAVNSFIDTTVLPSTGTYSLFADYLAANTGNVTLTLYSVPADVSGTITPAQAGDSEAVAVTVPGQNGVLTFSGTANQRISVKTSSFSPTGSVTLRRPDDSVQATISSGIAAAFMDTQVLATTGTYSVKVDPTNATTGTTTLTIYDVPADTTGTVTLGGSDVAVSPGTPGQNGTLTFSGTQGQTVTVKMSSNTIGTGGIRGLTTVRLLKPDGTQLTSSSSTALSFDLASQNLPTTGTYTIVVDPSGAHIGSINVRVTNP
jgi:YD repeat-containing protein